MSSTEVVVTGRFSRLAPRNWSLPIKLGAVLAVPIILALALGVRGITSQMHDVAALGASDRYVGVQDKASTLIAQLQQERDQSAVFVAGNRTGDRSALKGVFGAVDGGISDLDAAIGAPATLGGGPETAYQHAKDALSRLVPLRDQVTTLGVDPASVVARYTGLIEPLLVFESSLDRQLNSPALAGLAGGLTALNSAREQIALQHAVIGVAIGRGEMQGPDADTVRATDARLDAATDQFRAGLDADQQERLAGWTTSQADAQRQRLKQSALSRVEARGQLGITQTDWDNAYQAVLDELRTTETGLRTEIHTKSSAEQDKARNQAGITSVILLLGLLATSAVVYLIGRSLLSPLRVLRRTALDVADRKLPEAVAAMREGRAPDIAVEPVPVSTREEIGQVARAFDAVHGQAVRLAAEQATLQAGVSSMFINLSRRSQGLVERQLKLIEELERNEQDSEQLAHLFQLDHLATRMRRNSENLLVLAGSDPAKRANQTVPVVDVLRAAVSEIEQYQRVVVQTPPDVQVMGRAASDLVHLVAELLENATAFSPPDTQVVVSSTRTPDGSVLVEIADQGVGMPGEELIAANNRLAGPAEVNVTVSRRMGLYVVGRLASRHGIGVRLASSDPGRGATSGVTASVNVPSHLVSGSLTTEADLVRPNRPESIGGDTVRADAYGSYDPVGTRAGGNGSNGHAMDAPSGGPGVLPSRSPGLAAAAQGLTPVEDAVEAPADTDTRSTAGTAVAGAAAAAAAASAAAASAATATSAIPPLKAKPARQITPPGAPPATDTVGPGGLPRRSAGASLAGPLTARAAAPAAPPARQGPPPGTVPPPRGRDTAPDATRSTGTPRRSALRQPGALPSLRTPPSSHRPDGPQALRRPDGPQGPEQGQPPRRPITESGPIPQVERPAPDREQGPPRTEAFRSPPGPPTQSIGPADQPGPLTKAFSPSEQAGPLTQAGPPTRSISPADQPGPLTKAFNPGGPVAPPTEALQPPSPALPASEPAAPELDQPTGRGFPAAGQLRPFADPFAPDAPLSDIDPFALADPADADPVEDPFEAARAAKPRDAAKRTAEPSDTFLLAEPERAVESREDPFEEARARDALAAARPEAPAVAEADGLPDGRIDRPADGLVGAPDAPAETESPIFEEMASAWFRDNWDIPAAGSEEARLAPGPEVPAPPLPPDDWGDTDGWSTGEPLLEPFVATPAEELTAAGLPKRRRGENLIPGGGAHARADAPATTSTPSRSAEQVRGRLASYQQGVREGRQARHRADSTDAATSGQNVGSSRVDLQACKLEYSIVSPK